MDKPSTHSESVASFFKLYRYIIRHFKPYPFLLLTIVICICLTTAYECIVPLIYQWLFDIILPNKQIEHLIYILLGLSIGFILTIITNFSQTVASTVLSTRITNILRLKAFRYIQHINLTNADKELESNIVKTISADASNVAYILNHIVWTVLRNLLIGIVGIGLLIDFNWKLTLIVGIIFSFTMIIRRFFTRSMSEQLKVNDDMEDSLITSVQEAIAMQDVIWALRLQSFKRSQFVQKLRAAINACNRYYVTVGFVAKTSLLGISFTKFTIISIGVYFDLTNRLTGGELIGFIFLLDIVNGAISSLSDLHNSLTRGVASLDSLHKFTDGYSHQHRGSSLKLKPFSHSIRFIDVGLNIDGKSVLSNINLEIKARQSTAFVGPSGSGKSILLKLLLQEITPTSGQILFDGVNIQTIPTNYLLSQIGIVMQQPKLFEGSIKENIRMGKLSATNAEIIEAAEQAEIHQEINKFVDKYETQIAKRNNGLSGGQCQRIAIARTLISQPKILCVDEVTSALDPINGAAIEETLMKMTARHTVIKVTHRLSSVSTMDQIVVFSQGKIVEIGPHAQLLNNNNLYAKLWQKQQGLTLSSDASQAFVAPGWLKLVPFFKTLDDTILAEVASEFIIERADSDRIIFHEGDLAEKFYIIVAGIVEIVTNEQYENERTIAKLTDGDFFGEMALLFNTIRSATVKTKASCIFLTLHQQSFGKILAKLPADIKNYLLDEAKERLQENSNGLHS